MNVQELLESELSKAKKEVDRLVQEEEIAALSLQMAHGRMVEAELTYYELLDALSWWADQ